ncbi:MAG: hypothetical protein QGG26_11935 [Candidatus Undinarchaeales archaeon]|jgi:hypothetical protein|nr:hypothetical protein [Candidatus Undinarchaeales archaeon]
MMWKNICHIGANGGRSRPLWTLAATFLLLIVTTTALPRCTEHEWSVQWMAGMYLDDDQGYVTPEDPLMDVAYKRMDITVEVNIRIMDRQACSPRTFKLEVVPAPEVEHGTCQSLTPSPIVFSVGKGYETRSGLYTAVVDIKTGYRTGNCTLLFTLKNGASETKRLEIPVELSPGDCAQEPDLAVIGQARDDQRIAVQRPDLLGLCEPGSRSENGVCCPEGEVCCLDDSQCAPFGRCVFLDADAGERVGSLYMPARCDMNRNVCVLPPADGWITCDASRGEICSENARGCTSLDVSGGELAILDTTLRPLWFNRYPRKMHIPVTVMVVNRTLHRVQDATVIARFEGKSHTLNTTSGGLFTASIEPKGIGGNYLILAARKSEALAKGVTYISMTARLDLKLDVEATGPGVYTIAYNATDANDYNVPDTKVNAFLDGKALELPSDGVLNLPESSGFQLLRVCVSRDHFTPFLSCAEGDFCCRSRYLIPFTSLKPLTLSADATGAMVVPQGGIASLLLTLLNEGDTPLDITTDIITPPGTPQSIANISTVPSSLPAGGEARMELKVSVPDMFPCREMPLTVRASTGDYAIGLPLTVDIKCDIANMGLELAEKGRILDDLDRRARTFPKARLALTAARMAYLQAVYEAGLGRIDRAATLNATALTFMGDALGVLNEAGAAPREVNTTVLAMFLSTILIATIFIVREGG